MSDISDGSSGAARRAQNNEAKKTFFKKLFTSKEPSKIEVEEQSNKDDLAKFASFTSDSIQGQVGIGKLKVEDVAIPRAEIVSVQFDIALDNLIDVFRESGLTRLPVFEGTLDTPIGMIHLKDLALKHGFSKISTTLDLRNMVRPVLFAPPSMPILVLLQKMQSERIHMALVVDEYGGVDGLATLEDLIETMIGEIEDEHDLEEDALWINERPGVILAQAKAPLIEFQDFIGQLLVDSDEDDEIDTLGGLVSQLCGHVPVRGEVIIHPSGVEFEVLEADLRRIKRLRVSLPNDNF
jgi:magnesium and cobalt transporter